MPSSAASSRTFRACGEGWSSKRVMVMTFPLIPSLAAVIQKAEYRIVEFFWCLEVDEMADAFEHLDLALRHLRDEVACALDVVTHLAAQSL
jgi:hypothetical protein